MTLITNSSGHGPRTTARQFHELSALARRAADELGNPAGGVGAMDDLARFLAGNFHDIPMCIVLARALNSSSETAEEIRRLTREQSRSLRWQKTEENRVFAERLQMAAHDRARFEENRSHQTSDPEPVPSDL